MDVFFWIVALLLIGMGGYTGYTNWKLYFECRKAREQFKQAHADVQMFQAGRLRVWLYLMMLGACIGLTIMIFVLPPQAPNQGTMDRIGQGLVYVGLSIFALAMLGEGLADEQVLYTSDGFLYEKDVIRFKALRAVMVQKGMFKSSTLSLTNGKDVTVSNKMASWVQGQWAVWKENRKSQSKTRKERREAARENRRRK